MKRVKRFEKWILFPIDMAFIIFAILLLIKTDWFGGIFSLVISFIIGVIGQSLHKDKTAKALFRGEHWGEDENDNGNYLTIRESNLLSKALISSTIVLAITTLVLSLHYTSDGFWLSFLKGIIVGILFPFISLFFVLMLPKILEGYKTK